jgi:hypothetical protein
MAQVLGANGLLVGVVGYYYKLDVGDLLGNNIPALKIPL